MQLSAAASAVSPLRWLFIAWESARRFFERAPQILEAGAGMMLWPNATRVLKELGVLPAVIERSGASTQLYVRSQAGAILMNVGLGKFDVPAVCMRRSDLLAILTAAIPSDSIRLAHALDRFEQHGSGVRLHFENGAVEECDAMIGADGIRSRVRSQVIRPLRSDLSRLYRLAGDFPLLR